MSYPLLRADQSYSNIEVRQSNNTGASYYQMTVVYQGSVPSGWEYSGPEGSRVCVKCSNWPGDLTPQPAFCASGFNGISVGQPEVTRF